MNRPLLAACVLLLLAVRAAGIGFGYTEPNRIAHVAFPETGVIAEIAVREGLRVAAGEVLARLNCETLHQDLHIAREQERLQQLRFNQIKALYEAGNGSKEEYERAQSDLAIYTLRVRRILAQIDDRTLRAPFDGVVIKIDREVGESVSGVQTEVMTVVQLDSLRITLHLPAETASRLAPGGVVALLLDRQTPVEAAVEFVSPVIDAASRTVRVSFTIPNAAGHHRSGVHAALAGENDDGMSSLPGRRARPGGN